MTQTVIHPKDINLAKAEVFERAEAHELLRILRNNEPVHWNPGGHRNNDFWNITKYEDVLFVSRHPEIFVSSKGIAGSGLRPEVMAELMKDPATAPAATGSGNVSIITMDPPRHVKMRRLVNKGFTPRAVNAIEPEIRRALRFLAPTPQTRRMP